MIAVTMATVVQLLPGQVAMKAVFVVDVVFNGGVTVKAQRGLSVAVKMNVTLFALVFQMGVGLSQFTWHQQQLFEVGGLWFGRLAFKCPKHQ